MTRMGVISDEFWAVVESVMPSDEGKRGNRFGDHRLILEGIAWRFRTASPWRDLPADFGPWQTVWKRHHRWSLDGTYDEKFAQVVAVFGFDAEMVEDIETLLSVDSTNVAVRDLLHQAAPACCVRFWPPTSRPRHHQYETPCTPSTFTSVNASTRPASCQRQPENSGQPSQS